MVNFLKLYPFLYKKNIITTLLILISFFFSTYYNTINQDSLCFCHTVNIKHKKTTIKFSDFEIIHKFFFYDNKHRKMNKNNFYLGISESEIKLPRDLLRKLREVLETSVTKYRTRHLSHYY